MTNIMKIIQDILDRSNEVHKARGLNRINKAEWILKQKGKINQSATEKQCKEWNHSIPFSNNCQYKWNEYPTDAHEFGELDKNK